MQASEWNRVARDVTFNLEIDCQFFQSFVPKAARILDLGCGYGRNAELLYSLGYQNVVGVDTSLEMVKRGHALFPHLSLSHMEGASLPYPNETFSAVLVCAVFTCIPELNDRKDTMAEIYRVLKPSGILHLVEFCSDEGSTYRSRLGPVMRHSAPDEFRTLLGPFNTSKFEVTETATMNGDMAKGVNFFGTRSCNEN